MNSHDLMVQEDDLRALMRSFYLDSAAWDRVPVVTPPPDWKSVPYDRASRTLLPWDSGLYAFIVRPKVGLIPGHGYLLYIGKTGDGTSAATIRSRFVQYLREQHKTDGRPAVRSMLNRWERHLVFVYAEISDKTSIGGLEDALIAATIPPVNKSIASATLRYAAGAAFDR